MMNKILSFWVLLLMVSCSVPETSKIPCYAWLSGPGEASDKELKEQFADLKEKGIDGLMYSGGHDPNTYKRVGTIAKEVGMEFHAWIPAMVQAPNPQLKPEWYGVNGEGESAYDKPVYTDYYKFLCPSQQGVYDFLSKLYGSVADVPQVDGIHLDYIRFPDVILARGLWDKYGLTMDREYPKYDYCYCDKCVADFKAKTGIDIRKEEDPSQNKEWKQFRYDLITNMVNRISAVVHSKNKEINAAVFPGPNSVAKKLVRQQWDKWDLDAFYPMNYNDFYLEGTKWIGDVTQEAVSTLENRKPVYSGLFICPKPGEKAQQKDPENHGLLPQELEAAIRESMENGATGVCLFTPGRMTPEHWTVFEKAIHKQYVVKK